MFKVRPAPTHSSTRPPPQWAGKKGQPNREKPEQEVEGQEPHQPLAAGQPGPHWQRLGILVRKNGGDIFYKKRFNFILYLYFLYIHL